MHLRTIIESIISAVHEAILLIYTFHAFFDILEIVLQSWWNPN
jgi:hypothetical protein